MELVVQGKKLILMILAIIWIPRSASGFQKKADC